MAATLLRISKGGLGKAICPAIVKIAVKPTPSLVTRKAIASMYAVAINPPSRAVTGTPLRSVGDDNGLRTRTRSTMVDSVPITKTPHAPR